MYILIAGGGLIGKGLASRLVESKHDVVLIDRSYEVCEEIYSKYGVVTISGNATDIEILENAKIDKCDVAVAVMPSDADNLGFVLLANYFNVKQILARMNDPKYYEIYKKSGATEVARSTDLMIDQLLVNIESPEIRKVIGLGDIEICIVDMPENSKYNGYTVSTLVHEKGFPRNLVITAMFKDHNNSFVLPKGNTIIHSRDRLFICGSELDIKKAAKIIRKR